MKQYTTDAQILIEQAVQHLWLVSMSVRVMNCIPLSASLLDKVRTSDGFIEADDPRPLDFAEGDLF